MILRNFEDWKDCIVNQCRIKLTKDFAQKRLKVYENESHTETRQFVELYGKDHLNNIIYWYKKIAE